MKKSSHKKIWVSFLGFFGMLLGFTQCGAQQEIVEKNPVIHEGAYYQKWMSGVAGGGHGFIVYIPVDPKVDFILEEAYFKGKKIILQKEKNENSYIGRYTYPRRKEDMIFDISAKKEYGNKAPIIEEKIPFELKGNECIITYTKNDKKGHFKMNNLPEKELKNYPM